MLYLIGCIGLLWSSLDVSYVGYELLLKIMSMLLTLLP